jgi:hypothetical protein
MSPRWTSDEDRFLRYADDAEVDDDTRDKVLAAALMRSVSAIRARRRYLEKREAELREMVRRGEL